jgi:hypothetical protein
MKIGQVREHMGLRVNRYTAGKRRLRRGAVPHSFVSQSQKLPEISGVST